MSDEEGELADVGPPAPPKKDSEPTIKEAWSTPPPQAPEEPAEGPKPTYRSAPEAMVPMNAPPPLPPPPPPNLEPPKPKTRPATREDLEKSAGFELVASSSLFRIGGWVVLAGAALLLAQHLIILLGSVQFGMPFIQALFGGGGGNLRPTPDQILALLAQISIGMRLDLIGFAVLGVGCILVAIGARGLQAKRRVTGEIRKVPMWAVACGVAAGACFLGWVGLIVQVRTLLTGSATADWAAAVGNVFGAFGGGGSGGPPALPTAFFSFVANFTLASTLWIAATALLLAGAVLLYLFARGLRGATGMKPGLGVLVGFGVTAVIAIWFFIGAFTLVFAAAIAAAATPGGNVGSVIDQVLVSLAIGLGGKLFLLPLEGTILFLIMVFAGKRIASATPGKVYISKKERKGIAKRIKAGEQISLEPEVAPSVQAPLAGQVLGAAAPPASPTGEASMTALKPPPTGDVVVTLGGPTEEPPKDGT